MNQTNYDPEVGHRCDGCIYDGEMYQTECDGCRRKSNPWFNQKNESLGYLLMEDKYTYIGTEEDSEKEIEKIFYGTVRSILT